MVAIAVESTEDATEEREARRRELKACMDVREAHEVEALRVAFEAAKEVQLEREDLYPAEVLLRKLEGQFQPLTFGDVPRVEMERLQTASTREQAVHILTQCFRIALDSSFLAEVLAEFHYHNFVFCQRSRFNAEKASTMLSIMHAVMSRAVGEDAPVQKAELLFDTLLRRHSRQLPPFSVGVFSAAEARAVQEHAQKTLFRHYSMYLYVHNRGFDLSLRTLRESAAPAIEEPVELLAGHEVDPQLIPELVEALRDPEKEAAAAQAAAAEAQRLAAQAAEEAAATDAPPGDEREREVSSAIDEAMLAHLGDFEARLAVPAAEQP